MGKYVKGADQIARRFRGLSTAGGMEIEKALAKSANEVVARAKLLAPVDTGELRNSIQWEMEKRDYKGAGAGVRARVFVGKMVTATDKASGIKRLVRRLRRQSGTGEISLGRLLEFNGFPFFFDAYVSVAKRARGRVRRAMNKAIKGDLHGR